MQPFLYAVVLARSSPQAWVNLMEHEQFSADCFIRCSRVWHPERVNPQRNTATSADSSFDSNDILEHHRAGIPEHAPTGKSHDSLSGIQER